MITLHETDATLGKGERLLFNTVSLCPDCLRLIPMAVFEREGKALLRKVCGEHGAFEDTYWGDAAMLQRARRWAHDGKGIANPCMKANNPVCPRACGLCSLHKSHTALGNIVVTSRCNLNCFYCFFSHKNLLKLGYVYEPSLEQIRAMLRAMRSEQPVRCNAVQLTGGEPCLRDDIIDIIKIAKAEGYDHVQLNTNGIRLANEPDFAAKVRAAGAHTVYLSFDGVSPQTNPKNHWEVPAALVNCRAAELRVVLVPTVIKTVNDNDVGNILRFGIKHVGTVRAVNYQPVSFVGRMPKAERQRQRITIPDVIHAIAEQTDGMVLPDDWYPVPSVVAFTHFAEALTGRPKYELSAHPACGMATYLFLDGNNVIPIPRFVDVDGLMEYLNESAVDVKAGKNRAIAALKLLVNIRKFIDREKQPAGLDIFKMLSAILLRHNYDALEDLHHKSLMVGLMHFQDLYNYDIERVKRCCIHYAVPDGRILPFCTFNVIPEWYRDKVQKEFSVPIEEWEKCSGRKLASDLYQRNASSLEDGVYRKTYEENRKL